MNRDKNLPRPTDFRFFCECPVRFRDVDAMGHVNNAVYLTFLEVARTGYVYEIGFHPKNELLTEQFPFIIAEITIRFLSPLTFTDAPLIYLRTSRIGRKSFSFEYLMSEKHTQIAIATAQSVQVFYDYLKGETIEIPESFRALIQAFEYGGLVD